MLDQWVTYGGRTDQLPDQRVLVNVQFRDGQQTKAAETVAHWGPNWYWDRRFPGDSEIVAYKVVE